MHRDFTERKSSVTFYMPYLGKNHPRKKTDSTLIKPIPSYFHLVDQNKVSSF